MVDLLLESTEGDAKAEVEVIYSQYEATFAADELIGPPGEVEDAAEEGAADGGSAEGIQAARSAVSTLCREAAPKVRHATT